MVGGAGDGAVPPVRGGAGGGGGGAVAVPLGWDRGGAVCGGGELLARPLRRPDLSPLVPEQCRLHRDHAGRGGRLRAAVRGGAAGATAARGLLEGALFQPDGALDGR